ncbi:NAD(P)-binding protein [Xylaria acuta]|nr:NAD(P)-binding protein [Xylaria acuta]
MPSYVITGVSKGLGFLKKISSDPSNAIIGIVRNKPLVEKRYHSLEGDVTKYDELKTAAANVAAITGGGRDYLIANAAYLTEMDTNDGIGTIGQRAQELSDEFYKSMEANVLANIHLYNLFIPLILQGTTEKVINDYEIAALSLNAMSKEALNVVTDKFNAQYKRYGVLFLSVCPVFVDMATPEQKTRIDVMAESYIRYSPNFMGPITPTESIENGDGGRFLSHFGNKKWL